MKQQPPRVRATTHHLLAAVLATCSLLAACATPARPPVAQNQQSAAAIRTGRLSLRVEQDPQPQSFIASFELTGNKQAGTLRLFSPLGTTLATAQWDAQQAVLQRGTQTAHAFPSLEALLAALFEAPLPVHALFDWLEGRNTTAAGWQVDLSQYAQGKIRAQRLQPLPAAVLNVVLQ